jgi:hypothetical protein
VAVVWHGTLMEERQFRFTGRSGRVTVGHRRRNHFVVSGDAVPDRFNFLEQGLRGCHLQVLPGMTGVLVRRGRGRQLPLEPGTVKRLRLGDRGVLALEELAFLVELVRPEQLPRRPVRLAIDRPLAAALALSALVQIVVLAAIMLLANPGPVPLPMTHDAQLVRIAAPATSAAQEIGRPPVEEGP